MAEVNAGLFKKNDIRGVAMGERAVLTPAAALLIGRGIGTFLRRAHNLTVAVVGRDNRITSPALQAAVMQGIAATGIHITDLGLVSTPLVYWHAIHTGNSGGVMVTGSHLAPHYNGFKLAVGAVNIYDQDIRTIAAMVALDDFEAGVGQITPLDDAIAQFQDDLQARVTLTRSFSIVVDAGNGTAGLTAPGLLERWGQTQVTGLFLKPDGTFPNHAPNPQEPENMRALSAKVLEVGADIGFAFDGDADRVGVVDGRGRVIVADRLLALLARDLLRRHPGAAVVGEVLCSQVLFDAIRDAGGIPIMAPSGHSIVKETMRAHNALLGGEMSGHIFLAEDYSGADDAFLVMGRVLQLLNNTGKTLADLDDALPQLYSTPEYRPHCAESDKATVLAAMAHTFADKGIVNTVDGVRVTFANGWGIVRASNTEPVLSLRFEGTTQEDALAYQQLFIEALAAFPQVAKLV